jgi:hypothetical protein
MSHIFKPTMGTKEETGLMEKGTNEIVHAITAENFTSSTSENTHFGSLENVKLVKYKK